MRRVLLAWLLALSLAAAAADYPPVLPGKALDFPRDYGSHPDFRIEWWYVTGWLKDGQGRDYGFQVTFFRHRPGLAEDNPSAFAPRQLLFAHAALADPALGRLRQDQRIAREGFGLAQAEEADTAVNVGDWSLVRQAGAYRARLAGGAFALDLDFVPTQAPVAQGQGGYSRKGRAPQQASYYYSLPQLAVRGSIRVDGDERPVSGGAWLDHEWSSQMLAAEAVGWDWAGINLDDGDALMAFRLRDARGATVWAGGSYRSRQGALRILAPGEVVFTPRRRWRSPRSGADYPVAMRIAIPGLGLELDPLIDDQELDSRRSIGNFYWEGAVRARRDGRETGRGYLELTGYWRPLRF